MYIKKTHDINTFRYKLNHFFLVSLKSYRFIIILIVVFVLGVFLGREHVIDILIKPLFINPVESISFRIESFIVKPERLMIDVKYEDYQRLAYNRYSALQQQDYLIPEGTHWPRPGWFNLLTDEYRDEVPAAISYKDKKVRVKINLKGNSPEHFKHDYRWSFRVKVKGDHTVRGMKKFSLMKPQMGNYMSDWLLHRMLSYKGLIAPRFDFVEVVINGKSLGIYIFEEHFGKRMLENHQRREGPIIRFADNIMYRTLYRHPKDEETYRESQIWWASIDAYDTKKLMENTQLYDDFKKSKNLLEAFRQKELKASEVFDTEKLAYLIAVEGVFGHRHSSLLANIRFYYNPVISRLEPIANDGSTISAIINNKKDTGAHIAVNNMVVEDMINFINGDERWYHLLFQDIDFYEEYIRAVDMVSQKRFLDEFFSGIQDELDYSIKLLHTTYPNYKFNDKKTLYANQQYMRLLVEPKQIIQAYFYDVIDNHIVLEIGSMHPVPINIDSLRYNDKILLKPVENALVPGKLYNQTVKFLKYRFQLPVGVTFDDSQRPNLKIYCSLLGMDKSTEYEVIPWRAFDKSFLDTDPFRAAPNVQSHPFITVDENKKEIRILQGDWIIDHDLIIPLGYTVVCSGKTKLDLRNNSFIVSHSRVLFIGMSETPIIIHSNDNTGQGLFVYDVEEQSVFNYTVFDGLSSPHRKGNWSLTGAVTFYENPVEFSNTFFINNRSEDALNVIRTDVTLNNCYFENTQSDAFDGDFVTGIIDNSIFKNTGNDCVDVSGSKMHLGKNYFENAGDKGISVGEHSNITADNITVKSSEIAIACKDRSTLSIEKLRLDSCILGITAYQKKPEFGPAQIEIKSFEAKKLEQIHLIETGSKLVLEGQLIEAKNENVEAQMYRVLFGKRSKPDSDISQQQGDINH